MKKAENPLDFFLDSFNLGTKMIYAIQVRFLEYGRWSKVYTYKSEQKFERYDLVLVPTGKFLGVGKVSACVENFEFLPNINYKFVLAKLTELAPEYAKPEK